MKKSVKILIIISVCFVAVGMLLIFAAAASVNFDFEEMSGLHETDETYTYDASYAVENIAIDVTESDVRLFTSPNGELQIKCIESDKIYHRIKIEDGTLYITRTDTRKWFERIFNIYLSEISVTVYLPEGQYGSLDVKTVSGDVEAEGKATFNTAKLESTSGDVKLLSGAYENIVLTSVSGDIALYGVETKSVYVSSTSGSIDISDVSVAAAAEIKTTSGEIEATSLTAEQIGIKSTSGSVELEDTAALSLLKVETTSGDISFVSCDAGKLWLESVSGDVGGSLLSGKIYSTDTVSGRVSVPPSTVNGGECRISTTSGNIKISEK